MLKRLACLLLTLALLITSVTPVLAQSDIPEPFCGDLDEEDCDLLVASSEAMFALQSYTTAIEYKLLQVGVPELPAESEAVLRIDGQYAFDQAASEAMLTLASISREEPLMVVEEIGNNPDLLLDLYGGMSAGLILTLDLSESWTRMLEEDAATQWPDTTTIEARLVDGVLYLGISDLKEFIPDLKEQNDWVAIELVKAIEMAAEQGALEQLAAGVAASSEGRSLWGLDPTMLNLMTTMRSAFGRPKNLWPYMEIRRRRDANLTDQKGAVFQTDFNALDFILSDEFYDVLTQVGEVAVKSGEIGLTQDDMNSAVDFFWLLAPSLFRDLEISGNSTIGLEDNYQHGGKTVFHWDITTLMKALSGALNDNGLELADSIYIDFSTEFENSGFDEEIEVEAPEDAAIIPLDGLQMDGLEEFN